ncbi:NRDE family protein [Echinicola sediminis]
MCTVSYVPLKDGVVLTSNRDESSKRKPSFPPETYKIGNKSLTYPKDPASNGTWFVVAGSQLMVVLLNGAKEKHIPSPPYQLSRGKILLMIASATCPLNAWEEINLEQIEPFTIIMYYDKALYQLIWDGAKKVNTPLNEKECHIWSSSTLYPAAVRESRESWFKDFISTVHVDSERILDFHRNTKRDDKENGLVINRGNKMLTKSITQGIIKNDEVSLKHLDLIQNTLSLHHERLHQDICL